AYAQSRSYIDVSREAKVLRDESVAARELVVQYDRREHLVGGRARAEDADGPVRIGDASGACLDVRVVAGQQLPKLGHAEATAEAVEGGSRQQGAVDAVPVEI